MKKIFLIGLFLFLGFVSCDKDDDSNSLVLSGTFTETSPVSGRSQLKFVSGDRVIKKESGSANEDEFLYELTNNTIKLTPMGDNSATIEFEIRVIHNTKFQIENLYPSIPENPKTFMTFEK